jgi:hypothetical protein
VGLFLLHSVGLLDIKFLRLYYLLKRFILNFKVRFLNDQFEFTGRLVSGSWCSVGQQQGYLTLWSVNKDEGLRNDKSFICKEQIPVGNGVDVNDILWVRIFLNLIFFSIVNAQQFLASMNNGDVRIVNCAPYERNDNENDVNNDEIQQQNNQENKSDLMTTVAIYRNVHK